MNIDEIKKETLEKENNFLDLIKYRSGYLKYTDAKELTQSINGCLYCDKYYNSYAKKSEKCLKCPLSGEINLPIYCMNGLAVNRFEVNHYSMIIKRTEEIIEYINNKG